MTNHVHRLLERQNRKIASLTPFLGFSSADCDSSGFGGWGGGFDFTRPWGSDPRPGLSAITGTSWTSSWYDEENDTIHFYAFAPWPSIFYDVTGQSWEPGLVRYGRGQVSLESIAASTPKPPCTHVGSGQADISVSAGNIWGPTAGLIVTPDDVHHYSGLTFGPSAYPVSGSVMGREGKDVDEGLNFSFQFGIMIGRQYSGKLDLVHPVRSFRSGKWLSGATAPGVSVSVTNVTKSFSIPCL